MKRWIYFQPPKWREHHLMNFLVHQVMANGFRRSDVSAIPTLVDEKCTRKFIFHLNIASKSKETGEQSSPPKTVSQSALADIL